MSAAIRPPRLPRALVAVLLRDEMREIVLGDLDEEFARAIEAGLRPSAARRRYWRQALASLASRPWHDRAVRLEPAAVAAAGCVTRAVQGLTLDLRHAIRVLARTPAFTTVAVTSLAIGIGANTAMYNVVRALLIESLPVERPHELALVHWTPPPGTKVRLAGLNSDSYRDPMSGDWVHSNFTYNMFRAMRDAAGSSVPIFGFNYIGQANVSIGAQPPFLAGGMLATSDYFPVMGLTMAAGRPLMAADDRPDAPRVVVISHGLWTRAFGADRAAIGQVIRVNGMPCEIVGVTARGYRGLSQGGFLPPVDVTVPLAAQPDVMRRWTAMPSAAGSLFTSSFFWVRVVVRAPDGADAPGAVLRSALRGEYARLPAATPEDAARVGVRLLSGHRGLDALRTDTEGPLAILGVVVGVVLLIACANLAGLMLARGVARQRELAVRRALGAGRMRLVRVLMTESVILAAVGGGVGLLIAVWARPVVASMVTVGLGAAGADLSVSWELVGLTAAVATAAAILAGLVPAIRLTGGLATELSTRTGSSGPRLATGRALIALQIAVSVPLLVGAGLLVRTIYNLSGVDLGFDAAGLVAFPLQPGLAGANDAREPVEVYANVLERLRTLPGVTAATLVENLPISGRVSNSDGNVNGEAISVRLNAIGPQFFETMGIPLIAGRAIDETDRAGAPPVVVVSAPFAARYFPGPPPVGRHFRIGKADVEIVGVAAASRYRDLRSEPPPTVYDAYTQRSFDTFPGFRGFLKSATPGAMSVVLRTATPLATLMSTIPAAVRDVEPELPVMDIKTQTGQIADSIARERMFTRLLVTFGGFAVLLACIGLHGVTSYAVARRSNEIGIRIALGAQRSQVLWMILREVVVLALAGVALGVPIAFTAGPAMSSMLYGLAPRDVTTMAGAAALLLALAVVVGWLPARRAARLEVLSALARE